MKFHASGFQLVYFKNYQRKESNEIKDRILFFFFIILLLIFITFFYFFIFINMAFEEKDELVQTIEPPNKKSIMLLYIFGFKSWPDRL